MTAECHRCHQPFAYIYQRRARTVCDHCRKHDSDWAKFGPSGVAAETLRAQAACDICGTDYPGGRFGNWNIDHDHSTGARRGVLCAACNTAIGLLRDDPALLVKAVDYLRSHAPHLTSPRS